MFGRDSLAPLQLRDQDLSRSHFAIWKGPSGLYYLEDLKSQNGTFVDGARLPFQGTLPKGAEAGALTHRAELRDGAVIRAGNTLMVFRRDFSGSSTPDPPVQLAPAEGLIMVSPYGLRATRSSIDALRSLAELPKSGGRAPVIEPHRNLLLEAETGTGKEMMARYLAQQLRPHGPYVAINATALPRELFEANLFGHTRAAFTGASRPSSGIISTAEGGTLFLDEIHELERGAQVKLLRFLETRDFFPVGDSVPRTADVLVLVASSQALRGKVERGEWHRDMFARLNQLCLRIPPLRDRAEDIPELCKVMLSRQGHDPNTFPAEVEAVELLLLNLWPENLRGLLSALLAVLLESIRQKQPGLWHWSLQAYLGRPGMQPNHSVTLARITEALSLTSGDQSQAAQMLGINRAKLQRYLVGSRGNEEDLPKRLQRPEAAVSPERTGGAASASALHLPGGRPSDV